MTLIYTGKPGQQEQSRTIATVSDEQTGSNERTILNGTVQALTQEDQDGEKKKMKIVFVNDTIKEMTVNGKLITKEEMAAYEDEIMKIRQEMEMSQRELEKTQRELEEARMELEQARKEIDETREVFNQQELEQEINRELHGTLAENPANLEQFKNMWQQEEFREQMRKAQDEARKVMEEMRTKHRESWQLHQEEFMEQMKKAQEEARKAMEEWQKNKEHLLNSDQFRHMFNFYPPIPRIPEINDQDLPEIEDLIPAEPVEPLDILEDNPETPDQPADESINSKLKELEKE
jgi:DNA repair exonuclease SbcCD ATPase subunit